MTQREIAAEVFDSCEKTPADTEITFKLACLTCREEVELPLSESRMFSARHSTHKFRYFGLVARDKNQ